MWRLFFGWVWLFSWFSSAWCCLVFGGDYGIGECGREGEGGDGRAWVAEMGDGMGDG